MKAGHAKGTNGRCFKYPLGGALRSAFVIRLPFGDRPRLLQRQFPAAVLDARGAARYQQHVVLTWRCGASGSDCMEPRREGTISKLTLVVFLVFGAKRTPARSQRRVSGH
jgi:hypothetical protein